MLVKIKTRVNQVVNIDCDGIIQERSSIIFYRLVGTKKNTYKVVYNLSSSQNRIKAIYKEIIDSAKSGLVFQLNNKDSLLDISELNTYITPSKIQSLILSKKVKTFTDTQADSIFFYQKNNKLYLYKK